MNMLHKKYRKYALTLGVIMSVAFTGCNKKQENGNKAEQNQQDQAQSTTDSNAENSNATDSNTTDNQDNQTTDASAANQDASNHAEIKKTSYAKDYIENLTYNDYTSFVKIQDTRIPCEFQNTKNPVDWEQAYDITGNYDLNQDGTQDAIAIHYDPDSLEAQLTINDTTIDEFYANLMEAYIIDLDGRDSYTELVVYDGGMSADPLYVCYRYDGSNIIKLGGIASYYQDTVAFDGYGRAIRGDSFLNCLDPAVIPSYFAIEGDAWVEHPFDLSTALNQTYTIPNKYEGAYFDETNQVGEDYMQDWTEEGMNSKKITFEAGTKLTIKGVYEWERYWVELEDGRSGMLYFWIGD